MDVPSCPWLQIYYYLSSRANIRSIIGIAQLLQHFVADVDFRRAENNAGIGSAVEHKTVSAKIAYILHGIVDFVLDGLHKCSALFIEFAFGTKILALEVTGFLLLLHDGLLLGFLLLTSF